MAAEPLRVLVATPLGEGGNGGIDRLMDSLRAELVARPPAGMTVEFAATRGQGSILLAPLFLARVLWRMRAARPGLVHINLASHGSTYRKLIVAGWARALRIPYVLHLHGGGYRDFWGGARPALSRAIARMFERAARVLVLGTMWRELVEARAPAARVTVLANAVAAPVLPHVPASEVRLLFLGRLSRAKGAFDLVEALAALAEVPGWRAVLAGDGEIAAIRAAVEARKLGDRVEVPGWVSPDGVGGLLAASSILVLPSHAENLPLSVIEAMAAGLAVVATPVGAVPDIVTDGETGLLVPPGNVAALAEALGRLVADPTLRTRLGAAAREVHRTRLDIRPYTDALVGIWRVSAATAAS